jgi:hypothetical protein
MLDEASRTSDGDSISVESGGGDSISVVNSWDVRSEGGRLKITEGGLASLWPWPHLQTVDPRAGAGSRSFQKPLLQSTRVPGTSVLPDHFPLSPAGLPGKVPGLGPWRLTRYKFTR